VSFLRNRLGSAATGIATVVLAAGIVSTSLQSGGSPRSPLAGAAGTLGHTRESGLPTDTGAPSLAYPALDTTRPTPLRGSGDGLDAGLGKASPMFPEV
jgi:hypothetical protein